MSASLIALLNGTPNGVWLYGASGLAAVRCAGSRLAGVRCDTVPEGELVVGGLMRLASSSACTS